MNLISKIKLDLDANKGNGKGKVIVTSYRIANYVATSNNYAVKFLGFPFRKFHSWFIVWISGIEIPEDTVIGHSFQVWHGQALVLNKACVIGNNVLIRHSTTIGNKNSSSGCPIIGHNVEIGAHSILIGEITIGDNVKIGAGSIVTKSIPANSLAYGNPLNIKPISL